MFIVPRAGTITAMYVDMRSATGAGAPPGGATSRTLTLWWGSGAGTPGATAYSVTLSAAQSRNSAVVAQAVAAGDTIAIRHTDVGTPTSASCLVSIIID